MRLDVSAKVILHPCEVSFALTFEVIEDFRV